MLWITVIATTFNWGGINVRRGFNVGAWDTQPECEAGLIGEKDYGYTAGWELTFAPIGPLLVYKQNNSVSIAKCFSVMDSRL
tara:strand:- start:1693 stop:1938 length:246 start_codon:yes stop_codon:yes gene_type:complete